MDWSSRCWLSRKEALQESLWIKGRKKEEDFGDRL
jgi:hypothetical protein